MKPLSALAEIELGLAILEYVGERRLTFDEVRIEFESRFFSRVDIYGALTLLIERNELVCGLDWKVGVNSWKPEFQFSEIPVSTICIYVEESGRGMPRRVIKLPFIEAVDRPSHELSSFNALDLGTRQLVHVPGLTLVKTRDLPVPISW